VAVFTQAILEGLQLLLGPGKLFSQERIFRSQLFQFFVFGHTLTLAHLPCSDNLQTPY